jgi:hypothetical protein
MVDCSMIIRVLWLHMYVVCHFGEHMLCGSIKINDST